jgi:hypothetical protein
MKKQTWKCIFSGDASVKLWDMIKNIQDDELNDLLYLLGCKPQELESKVDRPSKPQKERK